LFLRSESVREVQQRVNGIAVIHAQLHRAAELGVASASFPQRW
jgi:two-component sensor histidine kinase